MLGEHSAISLPQSSEYAKEMRRHEAHETKWGKPGRLYTFQEFPKMLYKAEDEIGKGFHIAETRIVGDANEEANMLSRGFYRDQESAIAAVSRAQTDHAIAAAQREAKIRKGRHSEKAVAEIRAAEEANGARHLPDVPETPIKRRGRKPKTQSTESVPA